MAQDDPDPPRKFYGFKSPEFDWLNPAPTGSPVDPAAAPDPGITPPGSAPIDVHGLARIAAGADSPLGTNVVRNRPNEVHAILQLNLERDRAAGLYQVEATADKKRRRRIITYWTVLILVDSVFAASAIHFGPKAPIPFVSSIAGFGMFTAVWTWNTWFLRTD